MRCAAVAMMCLMVSACDAVFPIDDNLLTSRDWAERGPKREAIPDAYWCYRTIGRPECSVIPLDGQEHRLIEGGVQPPPPSAMPIPPPTLSTGPTQDTDPKPKG